MQWVMIINPSSLQFRFSGRISLRTVGIFWGLKFWPLHFIAGTVSSWIMQLSLLTRRFLHHFSLCPSNLRTGREAIGRHKNEEWIITADVTKISHTSKKNQDISTWIISWLNKNIKKGVSKACVKKCCWKSILYVPYFIYTTVTLGKRNLHVKAQQTTDWKIANIYLPALNHILKP